MAQRSFIQFTYSGRITDGNRSAYTLCNELSRIIGYLDIISPSVRATALGCTFSLLLNQRDFCLLTRRDNMLKLLQHGFKFPETPSNKNLCTVVYNAYYSDSQVRRCLENHTGFKHHSGNHKELNVHTITKDNYYNYYICYNKPYYALEASYNGISLGGFYIEPQELRLYKNIHVSQCMHCYKWDKHPTSRCPNRTVSKACSLCLGYHHFKLCSRYNNKEVKPICRNCKGPHSAVSKGCRLAKEAARNGNKDLTLRPPTSHTIKVPTLCPYTAYTKHNNKSNRWDPSKHDKYYDASSGQLIGYNPHSCRPQNNNHIEKRPHQQQNHNNSYSQAVKNNNKKSVLSGNSQIHNKSPINNQVQQKIIPCQQDRNYSHPKAVKTNKSNAPTDTIKSKYNFKPINSIKPKSLQKL